MAVVPYPPGRSLRPDYAGSNASNPATEGDTGGRISLGLETVVAEHLSDGLQGLHTQFRLTDLLRPSVYSPLAGYEDLHDAGRRSADPTFRLIGAPKIREQGAALTSTLHELETELLTREENLVGLLPSAASTQRARRLRGGTATTGRRPQRRRVGRVARTGDEMSEK